MCTDMCTDMRMDMPGHVQRRVYRHVLPSLWINDAGHRSYYRGLTMLATVHIVGVHVGVPVVVCARLPEASWPK